jgi:genome maintenance exonuclease 1|tara:strand:+ start:270 stop:974 length:705 start_codon:yes stop_codon:yes gene_type:complete
MDFQKKNKSPTFFPHEEVEIKNNDLKQINRKSGRVYMDEEGNEYPSITSVLSILSKEGIMKWRERVGEEEANRISGQAIAKGNEVHNLLEMYVGNELQRGLLQEAPMPYIMEIFNSIQPIIDQNLSKVYATEQRLHSKHLKVAGTVDCVGVWNGKNSIIDWKTSNKWKKKEWVSNYFMQCAGYSIMWEELTKMPITQLVVCIAGDQGPQIFIEHRDNWDKELIETIDKYKRRKE